MGPRAWRRSAASALFLFFVEDWTLEELSQVERPLVSKELHFTLEGVVACLKKYMQYTVCI